MTAPDDPLVEAVVRVATGRDDAYSARALGIMALGQVLNGEHGTAAGMLAALTPDQCATVAAAADVLVDLAQQAEQHSRRRIGDDEHLLALRHSWHRPADGAAPPLTTPRGGLRYPGTEDGAQ